MASMWRDCPACGGRQPCKIDGVVDRDPESKRARATFTVSCVTCGHTYPNPADMAGAQDEAAALRDAKRGS